jgi:hypothetical protein
MVRLEDMCKPGYLGTYLGQTHPRYPRVHGPRLRHTTRAVGLQVGMVGKLEWSALV